MQSAKDSFYMALRNRVAALTPERTILLRGAVRPGILVEDAEAPFPTPPGDVFILRWLGHGADITLGSTLIAEECEIYYSTCGCQTSGGLDRGRALSQMDGELLAILQPFSTPKVSYSVQPPTTMLTQVFWDEPVFSPAVTQRDGTPRPGAKMQQITGFIDREGGSFYPEWSGLFVMEGAQGERILFYYPRLQPRASGEESTHPLASKGQGTLERIALNAHFLALPVTDPLDNERVVCYRSFLPAQHALI